MDINEVMKKMIILATKNGGLSRSMLKEHLIGLNCPWIQAIQLMTQIMLDWKTREARGATYYYPDKDYVWKHNEKVIKEETGWQDESKVSIDAMKDFFKDEDDDLGL